MLTSIWLLCINIILFVGHMQSLHTALQIFIYMLQQFAVTRGSDKKMCGTARQMQKHLKMPSFCLVHHSRKAPYLSTH